MESACQRSCVLLSLLGLTVTMALASPADPSNLAHHYFLSRNVETALRDYDARQVTWAHAVNSREFLERELAGSADVLEADVSLGHVVGKEFGQAIPVMAHPPNTTSDLSLDTWLDTLIARESTKGIKLDFKSLDVVAPSLMILERHVRKLSSTIVLNADVLPGPVNSSTIPVPADTFLSSCRRYFPKAIVSIGWTTYWFAAFPPETWHYEWQHVRKMVDVIRCSGYENIYPTFTFPVRGVFASRSTKELQWLLSMIPTSSLTVWSAKFDALDLEDLKRIRAHFPKYRVYYDIPEPLGNSFRNENSDADNLETNLIQNDDDWTTVTKGEVDPCLSSTYINGNDIVFGKSLTTAVLHKNLLHVDARNNLKIRGRLHFFSYGNPISSNSRPEQELDIVLIDVKLFSKNITSDTSEEIDVTQGDTDVIWSAINASQLHKFKHSPSDKANACRIFNLDTASDRSFEAWIVPCDVLREESRFEEVVKSGIQEISFRKRLVLPEGPFMLGFISSGQEFVVVHDLEITGKVEAVASGVTARLMGVLSSVVIAMAIASFCYGMSQ